MSLLHGIMAATALWGILALPAAYGATATVTQTLNAQLAAIGKVSVPASISLNSTGAIFNLFTGSLLLNYRVRTSQSGPGGSITVQPSADFTPAGGPTIPNNTFTYTCSGATLGTACSGTLTMSLTSATNVLTIPASACTGGGGSCSSADPNTVDENFSLVDDPNYKTGNYSVSLIFTISST